MRGTSGHEQIETCDSAASRYFRGDDLLLREKNFKSAVARAAATENATGAARTATFTFASGSAAATLVFTQQAAGADVPAPAEGTLELSPDTVRLNAAQGSFEVSAFWTGLEASSEEATFVVPAAAQDWLAVERTAFDAEVGATWTITVPPRAPSDTGTYRWTLFLRIGALTRALEIIQTPPPSRAMRRFLDGRTVDAVLDGAEIF